eukprot:1043984-Rhodomonas_salina.2
MSRRTRTIDTGQAGPSIQLLHPWTPVRCKLQLLAVANHSKLPNQDPGNAVFEGVLVWAVCYDN